MAERLSRELIALRVAAELRPGEVVNLGIGMPTLVANYVPASRGVVLHSENGILRYGPHAEEGAEDLDFINARGEHTTWHPGGAVISHTDAFSIVRSGRLDVAVLGALQVSERGDLSNWMVPSKGIGSPGGGLDMAAGAKRLIAIMEHSNGGAPKILRQCDYPLTVAGRVNLIVTDIAVIEVTAEGLVLKEQAPGWSAAEIQSETEARLDVTEPVKEMDFGVLEESPPSKVFPSAAAAVADIPDGAVILMDGFGGIGGMSHYLMLALRDQGARELTVVGNTVGIARVSTFGQPPSPGLQAIDHSILVERGQIKHAIASFPVSPSPSRPSAFEEAYRRGEVTLELAPQGTLAERLRAGGAGIPAFFTPTGAGTVVAEGKETRIIDGREYVMERAIRGNFGFIRAHKADTAGNLVYRGTSRNFNAAMATAAEITIAEVDEIVEAGTLDPDAVVTPGLYVDRIVQRPAGIFSIPARGGGVRVDKERLPRDVIAMRVAKELPANAVVNLGIGIPTLVSNYLEGEQSVSYHSESGVLNYGPLAEDYEKDYDLINAGGQFLSWVPGMSFFGSDEAFAMIRGGHVDVTVLGALQVSEAGDLANWMLPQRGVGNIGGAMDLAVGAKRVIVAMEHTDRRNRPKVVKECTFPLTGRGCVSLVVTDLAVIEVTPAGMVLREVAPDWTAAEVQALTEPTLKVAQDLKEYEL